VALDVEQEDLLIEDAGGGGGTGMKEGRSEVGGRAKNLGLPSPFLFLSPSPSLPPRLFRRERQRRKKLRETRPLTFEKFDEIFFCAPLDKFVRKGGVSGSWCR
jgi:hypothetical protein